jgi:hypothetical protein
MTKDELARVRDESDSRLPLPAWEGRVSACEESLATDGLSDWHRKYVEGSLVRAREQVKRLRGEPYDRAVMTDFGDLDPGERRT